MSLQYRIPKTDVPTHMPFGKHKGKKFADIPSDYLRWLQEQDWVHASLIDAIEEESTKRDREGSHWEE